MAKTLKISLLADEFEDMLPKLEASTESIEFLTDLGGSWSKAAVLGVEAFKSTVLTEDEQNEIDELVTSIKEQKTLKSDAADVLSVENAVKVQKIDVKDGVRYIAAVTTALGALTDAIAASNEPFDTEITSLDADRMEKSRKRVDSALKAFKKSLGDTGRSNVNRDGVRIAFDGVNYCFFGKDSGETLIRVETGEVYHKPKGNSKYIAIPERQVTNGTEFQRMHRIATTRDSYGRKAAEVKQAFKDAYEVMENAKTSADLAAIGMKHTGGVSHVRKVVVTVRDEAKQTEVSIFRAGRDVPAKIDEFLTEIVKAMEKPDEGDESAENNGENTQD